MSKAESIRVVKKYANKLKSKDFPFVNVYLFGSFSQGTSNEYSDLDVAIIFNNTVENQTEQEDKLWQLTREVDSRIEPVSFTIKDFEENENPLVYEIKTKGIKVM